MFGCGLGVYAVVPAVDIEPIESKLGHCVKSGQSGLPLDSTSTLWKLKNRS